MLNHITIMGRLTRDPEQRSTSGESFVTRFTVAVDRDFGGRDGEKQTDFIDCVAWSSPTGRKTGEFVHRYFHKGSMIVVSGRLQSRKWQDSQNNNRVSWEVVADNVYFGESRRDGDSNRADSYSGNTYSSNSYGSYDSGKGSAPASTGGFTELDDGDGELPF